jgi:hypothetical protein
MEVQVNADRAARTVALLIFLAAATAMCLQIMWLARGLRIDLIPKAQAVVQQASTTLDNSNVALKSWQQKADDELRETKKATADLHDLLIHTDISLNGRHGDGGILGDLHAHFIPRADDLLVSSNLVALRLAANVDRVGDSTGEVVSKAGSLVVALTARVQDPQYDAILANAAQSMSNLTAATESAAHSLKTADEVVTKEAQIILAPASKVKVAILFVLTALGKFFGY